MQLAVTRTFQSRGSCSGGVPSFPLHKVMAMIIQSAPVVLWWIIFALFHLQRCIWGIQRRRRHKSVEGSFDRTCQDLESGCDRGLRRQRVSSGTADSGRVGKTIHSNQEEGQVAWPSRIQDLPAWIWRGKLISSSIENYVPSLTKHIFFSGHSGNSEKQSQPREAGGDCWRSSRYWRFDINLETNLFYLKRTGHLDFSQQTLKCWK